MLKNLNEYLSKFKFLRLSITVQAIDNLKLQNYKGSTLRGLFGHAFKCIFCKIKADSCVNCPNQRSCYYSYIFETPVMNDADIMRKYTNAPHPFVIVPPLDEKCEYVPGETLTFEMIIIGNAVEYYPYFAGAFTKMGETGIGKQNGKFKVMNIDSLDYSGNRITIFCGQKKCFVAEPLIIDFSELKFTDNVTNIDIAFLTPTRIKFEEKVVNNIQFHYLIRNLLRRIAHLYYFHVNKEKMDIDFNACIDYSEKIKTKWSEFTKESVTRYSNRQQTKMTLDGIQGFAKYEGDLTEFYPLLKFGELVNIGKGTAFGFGKYLIQNSN